MKTSRRSVLFSFFTAVFTNFSWLPTWYYRRSPRVGDTGWHILEGIGEVARFTIHTIHPPVHTKIQKHDGLYSGQSEFPDAHGKLYLSHALVDFCKFFPTREDAIAWWYGEDRRQEIVIGGYKIKFTTGGHLIGETWRDHEKEARDLLLQYLRARKSYEAGKGEKQGRGSNYGNGESTGTLICHEWCDYRTCDNFNAWLRHTGQSPDLNMYNVCPEHLWWRISKV